MEEKVRSIQARLRATLAQPLTLGPRAIAAPIVSFETVAGVPEGAENVVSDVIAALKRRGYRVANIRRFSVNTEPASACGVAEDYRHAGSDATLLALPGYIALTRAVDAEPTLDELLEMLGDGYDAVIGEAFGYLPVPKILVTKKVQEGFSLGLPNIIGYVADRDGGAMIPRFSPYDIEALADKIEADIIESRAIDTADDVRGASGDAANGSGGASIDAAGIAADKLTDMKMREDAGDAPAVVTLRKRVL